MSRYNDVKLDARLFLFHKYLGILDGLVQKAETKYEDAIRMRNNSDLVDVQKLIDIGKEISNIGCEMQSLTIYNNE